MTISAPIATLVASSIAAIASVVVLVMRLRSGESAEARAAYRDELRPYVQEMGDALYMLVACATLYARDHATKNRDHWNRQLDAAAHKLRGIRFRVRYQLWGLDEGLRSMVFLSFWIRQAEAGEEERKLLVAAATASRKLRDLGLGLSVPEDIDLVRDTRQDDNSYPKILGEIVSREGTMLTVLSLDGVEHTVDARHRSGKGSRRDAQPGAQVKLYRRPSEDFFRYRFVGG